MKRKQKRISKEDILHQTGELIEYVADFLSNIQGDTDHFSKQSKALSARIMKEWSKSIAAGQTHFKNNYKGKNKIKYSKLLKTLAEFFET